jgi:prepilin-type processing-associated H-X9-DG protein
MYTQDWDDRLPPKGQWQSGVMPYIKNTAVFACPDRPNSVPGYAFNAALDRRTLKQISMPASAPMLFDSSLGVPEANDKLQSFVTPHRGTGNVAYVDGHVLSFSAAPSATAGLKAGTAK